MPAGITRLRTRADRLRADQAAAIRDFVLDAEGLPPRAVAEIVAAIDRATAAEKGTPFVLLSAADNLRVVNFLVEQSTRPMVAVRLWALLLQHLDWSTGEVLRTRDEMAEALGVPASNVSSVMTELETLGAISRRRERVAGMRGPGAVRVFVSPHVATHLPGAAREKAQREAPGLRLVPRVTPA